MQSYHVMHGGSKKKEFGVQSAERFHTLSPQLAARGKSVLFQWG